MIHFETQLAFKQERKYIKIVEKQYGSQETRAVSEVKLT